MKELKLIKLIFLLTLLMSMMGIEATAHDIEVANSDGVTIYYKWANNKTELSVTYRGYDSGWYSNEYTGSVVIPENVTYNGKTYSVTSIGSYAFYECTDLTRVTIPNSVTSIGNGVFFGCSGLTFVTIPGSVTSIGDAVFSGCSGLTIMKVEEDNSVYDSRDNCNAIIKTENNELIYGCKNTIIPNSVTSIGNNAFYHCSGLTSVEIPGSVTSIGEYAFCGCSGLTSVEILGSVKSIGASAFRGCSGLTSVTIGSGVTSIGASAFHGCDGLTSVEIPNSVTSIGEYAFCGCSGLTSVTIPGGVTSIGESTFEGCSGLTSVTIGSGVTSIGESTFEGCSGLTSVEIPNSVTSIGRAAFASCSGLTSITIPNGVTSIGYRVFSGCSGLTSVEIPNSVTSIGEYAFLGCSGLTSVIIPNSVTSLGGAVFSGCSGLTSVTIPSGVTSIEERTFEDCSGLTSVTIPSGVTSIGDKAFYKCSGLTSVEIPGGVTSIGRSAFNWCRSLTSITIPSGVTSIGDGAFCQCDGLTCSITIPNGVTSIGNNTFYNCSGLTSVEIPNSVTSIGEYAFCGCYGLTSITIPGGVTSIGKDAFCDCLGLTFVISKIMDPFYIDDSVFLYSGHSCVLYVPVGTKDAYMAIKGWKLFEFIDEITEVWTDQETKLRYDYMHEINYARVIRSPDVAGEVTIRPSIIVEGKEYPIVGISTAAFNRNGGLTGIVIPNGVSSIGDYAFNYCSGLTSVEIPNSVTSIGASAFYQCHGLTCSITIPNGVKSIEKSTFSGCSGLTSVEIPNSVTSIGNNAFYHCSGLTSVEIPNSVTSIGDYAFDECRGLTSVTIPNSVTSIGKYAFWGCSGLTSVTIPNSVTGIGNWAFTRCSGLTSITSLIEEPFAVECFDKTIYNKAILFVPAGTIDAYMSTEGWDNFENIYVIGDFVNSLVLCVLNETGTDVTDNVNIVWYDADGKQIGAGNRLVGLADNAEVYYSVTLNEKMGRVYREVKMQKVVVSEDPLTCQLEKIGRVALEGRVSATDIDKNTMAVSVHQMLNGKWELDYETQTNEQGEFSVEVYDDETDITFSGDGYFDTTIHRDGFSGNGNVGTIPVSLLYGFAIAANITMQITANETTAWVDRLNNIEFTLSNTTKGTVITDFTVQGSSVIIKSGAGAGDNISLTARSKQGIFADVNTSFILKEESNSFDLQLTELGGVDATYAGSNNGNTAGYLYNSSDMLVAKGSYVGETLSLRHLPSGTYTLVSMGQSLLFGNMTQLGDLSAVGLTEGADYVTTRVEIANGTLAAVSVNAVPRIDDTRFYYTNSNTYFNVNKPSVTAGNYVTLSAHIDLKPEYAAKIEEMKLTVYLPEGCQLVENSVIANHKRVTHTVNGNRLAIMLNKEQIESQVLFCVIPTLNQSYSVTAIASFNLNGEVQQPVGTTQFEAKGLSLSVPTLTADSIITINGTAKGHSEVSIYDNDVLIGKTSSKADGSWTAQCELYKPYSHSFHEIYAKITTETGMELTSEIRQVEYDKYDIVPEKITMLYYNPEYVCHYNIIFDLINGTTSPCSYYFYPFKNCLFTFLADFTRNDSTQIKNVNIKVLNTDGTIRTLPATFDGAQNCWVASTMYESSSRIPQNATVEYDLIQPINVDFARIAYDNNQFINMINDYILNVDSTALAVLEEDGRMAICQYKTLTMDKPIYMRIEQLDYDRWITQLERSGFFTADNNGRTVCIKDSTLADEHAMWIWTNDNKCLMQIELSANNQFVGEFTFDNVAQSRFKNVFDGTTSFGELIRNSVIGLFDVLNISGIRDIINEYNRGYDELQYWIKQYGKTTDNHMALYNKTKTLLFSKCPDGSNRLSATAYNIANTRLNNCYNAANRMRQEYRVNLDRMERDLVRRRNASSILSAASQLIGIIPGLQGGGGSIIRNIGSDLVNNIGLATAQDAYNMLIRNQFYTADQLSAWYFAANNTIITDYSNLKTYVQNAYKKCKEKEKKEEQKDEPVDEKSGNKPDFPSKDTAPLIDPSGYVYEAVESNRLEGVTTTCYQQVNGTSVVWNAEDYSQQNPLKTDATGFYRWDVQQGMWQVKYEKEGYETAYSEWLPVPPPQLDVNIGMRQSTPPTVKQMRGYESGIIIEMTKYMQPQTMNTMNITVTRNGEAETGHIELMNAEQAPQDGESFVSKVKFVPDNHFHINDVVVVTVHKEVESYCGVPMTADHVGTVRIEKEITAVVADSVVTVAYHGERELQVLVLPKEASSGRTLRVRSSSPMIASVSNEEVTIDQNGMATLTVDGNLPGGAVVDFTIDGTDTSATSKIKVVMAGDDLVATPTASIASGSTVEQGAQVVLSCATEGATIYYTLDGSCPCDEQTRQVYSSPITIRGDVTIKAIAVKEDMDDSDVATFIYLTYPVQVVAKSYTREYGDENPVFEFTVSGGTLDGVPAITCEATATSPVGTYPIVVSKGTVGYHNVTYVAGTLTVTKAPLTIKAGTYTKRQYEPMPEFTLSYEGFKNGETAVVLTTQPTVTCNATEDSAPGVYPVVVAGAIAQNYDITFVDGTLTVIEPATYTLTYMVDGEVYKTFTLKQNEVITPEPEPIKEGYTFSGWSEIPETMPAHDVTVTGTFSVNNYTLTYVVDGQEYKKLTVAYGAIIKPVVVPEKEGYTFSGWTGLPETMPAHDVTVTGTFSVNSYTLTYMIGEEVYKQVAYEYGAAITPEPAPEGDYKTFEWVGVPETMPAHDVTVTAVFETGIDTLLMMAQQGLVRIYTPNGKLIDRPQHGLNIVVTADGTVRKVVVR